MGVVVRTYAINRALKLPGEIFCAMAAIRMPGSRTCDSVEALHDQNISLQGAPLIPRPRPKEIGIGVVRVTNS